MRRVSHLPLPSMLPAFRSPSPQLSKAKCFSTSPRCRDPVPWLLLGKIVVGVPAVVWAYKCAVLVLFQRHLIYLSYIPWGVKKQTLEEYQRENPASFRGIRVEERLLLTSLGRELRGLSVTKNSPQKPPADLESKFTTLLYLQGNASTPLYRIPVFRSLILSSPTPLRIISYAPRSYWLSNRNGGPSQRGFISDYLTVYRSLAASEEKEDGRIVIMGHSIGAASAVGLVDNLLSEGESLPDGVILENAFTSIPQLVKEIYPNKWLPYRYLGWAVLDKWNAVKWMEKKRSDWQRIPLLMIRSEKDEVVPGWMGERIFESARRGSDGRVQQRMVVVPNALHDTAYLHSSFTQEIHRFISKLPQRSQGQKGSD
ncbi:hypothetical protein BT69DRAFT_1350982 [Atractiella rhizophila]|nr:hypothetical protein BT69DRAFT_1350982 [Atractiella rhizophila]